MAITAKNKLINEHLSGMHKHLRALEDEIYLGNGVKKKEARKLYKDLLRVMEALDFALDPRSEV